MLIASLNFHGQLLLQHRNVIYRCTDDFLELNLQSFYVGLYFSQILVFPQNVGFNFRFKPCIIGLRILTTKVCILDMISLLKHSQFNLGFLQAFCVGFKENQLRCRKRLIICIDVHSKSMLLFKIVEKLTGFPELSHCCLFKLVFCLEELFFNESICLFFMHLQGVLNLAHGKGLASLTSF